MLFLVQTLQHICKSQSDFVNTQIVQWTSRLVNLFTGDMLRSWPDIAEMHKYVRFDIFQHNVMLELSHLSNLNMNNKSAFGFMYFSHIGCVIYSFVFITSLNK